MQRALVLVAEDSESDQNVLRMAARQAELEAELRFVANGVELLAYLRREGRYAPAASSPTPSLVILDLVMPRKSGFESLAEIKADPRLRKIPIITLTRAGSPADAELAHYLGAAAFIAKPDSLDEYVDFMRGLGQYWSHRRS